VGWLILNYLNTEYSNIHFQKTIRSKIFVDKSGLIESLNNLIGTADCYVCITRPRRFGKTVNANMLGAYYTKGYDTRSMFSSLSISRAGTFEENINKHNVVFIDFSRMPEECNSYKDYIDNIISNLKADIKKTYNIDIENYSNVGDILKATKDQFIFIFDEWDSIFYKTFMSRKDKNSYVEFLKGLLKDQPYVELVYMTGVLPIVKYSSGSELNMFDEYNFMNDNVYDRYFGFDEDEVKQLCNSYGTVSYEDMKKWYDGYYLSDGRSLFNPRSVSRALMRGICLNYWTETGPMNEIADCIENNIGEVREDIVKLVAGIPVEINLKGYSAIEQQLDTRDEILSAMVVYGFLSYHDGYLRIPNYELMEKFQDVLSRDSFGEVKQVVKQSKSIVEATISMEEDVVAKFVDEVHDREIPFLKYSDENSLSCVITLCYLYARKDYYIEREYATGKGYCDYIFIPKKKDRPAIILELKYGHSPEEAIMQIKDRNYISKVKQYKEILLVGINYDDNKGHTCKIERIG
jgi:hypothetical protein